MSNKYKKNLIVTLADRNYLDTARQLFSSLYFNGEIKGDYMLITNGLSDKEKSWFENKGIIVYSPPLIDNVYFNQHRNYPPLLLSKFYLFSDYFKKWNKIIFLDADAIVQGSLKNLLKLTD